MRSLDDVREEVDNLIANNIQTLSRRDAGMCTGWVMVVEVTDEQGDRWLATLDNKDATAWARMGWLTAALSKEQDFFLHPEAYEDIDDEVIDDN